MERNKRRKEEERERKGVERKEREKRMERGYGSLDCGWRGV